MDAVFYFSFETFENFFDESSPVRSVGFYIANILQPWDEVTNHLSDTASDLKDAYGAHNCCTSPAGVNAVGYTSHEVEVEHRAELMEQWRQAFLKICPGCEVSAVYELPYDPKSTTMQNVLNNAEILQYLKDAHEHTQAQQLRNTLATHVLAPVCAAPPKKI